MHSLDMDYVRVPVANRIYFSSDPYLALLSRFTNGDQFDCNWKQFTISTTNDFKSYCANPTFSLFIAED